MRHLLPLAAVALMAATSAGEGDDAAGAPAGKRSLDVLLATEFDVDFQDESLALVLESLEKLVAGASPKLGDGFAIRLLGNDLKFAGITRNQRVRSLKLKQKPLAEILTVIVSRANPIQAGQALSDPRQILVWAIGPDPQAEGKQAVLITTRRGAQSKGLRLPAVFLAEPVWSEVISAGTLEAEIKAVSLALPQAVAHPSRFRGGGYKEARLQFNELALLFAVISRYDKPVRWHEQAASLARMNARAATACKAGSQQSFNKAAQGRDNLAVLVGGGEVQVLDGLQDPIEDWGAVYDRAPAMQRMERALSRTLSQQLDDKSELAASQDAIVNEAELIAVISTAIRQKGLENADDANYVRHAEQLSFAARALVESARSGDRAGAQAAVVRIKNACTQCHEEFR